jgi:hypothetical protein
VTPKPAAAAQIRAAMKPKGAFLFPGEVPGSLRGIFAFSDVRRRTDFRCRIKSEVSGESQVRTLQLGRSGLF